MMEEFIKSIRDNSRQYTKFSSFFKQELGKFDHRALEVAKKETARTLKKIESTQKRIVDINDNLSKHSRTRKRLENLTIPKPNLQNLDHAQQYVYSRLIELKKLKKHEKNLKEEYSKNEMSKNAELRKRNKYEAKEKDVIDLLDDIFSGFHHLFPKEEEIRKEYLEIESLFERHEKILNKYNVVMKAIDSSKENFDHCFKSMQTILTTQVDIDKKKSQIPEVIKSKLSTISSEHDILPGVSEVVSSAGDEFVEKEQVQLVQNSKGSLKRAYRKMFSIKGKFPKDKTFEKFEKKKLSRGKKSASGLDLFGKADVVLDVFQIIPHTEGGGGGGASEKVFDIKKLQASLDILASQEKEMGRIQNEWKVERVQNLEEMCEGLRSRLSSVRLKLIQKRRSIISKYTGNTGVGKKKVTSFQDPVYRNELDAEKVLERLSLEDEDIKFSTDEEDEGEQQVGYQK